MSQTEIVSRWVLAIILGMGRMDKPRSRRDALKALKRVLGGGLSAAVGGGILTGMDNYSKIIGEERWETPLEKAKRERDTANADPRSEKALNDRPDSEEVLDNQPADKHLENPLG